MSVSQHVPLKGIKPEKWQNTWVSTKSSYGIMTPVSHINIRAATWRAPSVPLFCLSARESTSPCAIWIRNQDSAEGGGFVSGHLLPKEAAVGSANNACASYRKHTYITTCPNSSIYLAQAIPRELTIPAEPNSIASLTCIAPIAHPHHHTTRLV